MGFICSVFICNGIRDSQQVSFDAPQVISFNASEAYVLTFPTEAPTRHEKGTAIWRSDFSVSSLLVRFMGMVSSAGEGSNMETPAFLCEALGLQAHLRGCATGSASA